MLRWVWLEPAQRTELQSFVDGGGAGGAPAWFAGAYNEARLYRIARARRWAPTPDEVGDLRTFGETERSAIRAQIEQGEHVLSLDAWEDMDADEKDDVVYQRVWRRMPEAERRAALDRVTYECARRLGWRHGYSSGYPGAGVPKELLRRLATHTGKAAARRELRALEEAQAWAAWQALTPAERRAEWETAWRQRDRSVIYVDDAPRTRLLGAPAPRWYATPQRAGTLTFLPNVVVRLVRNQTPRGQPYDVWKATFRVPLSMHKHELRSFLLAVYGLRTTWARSMVYRSRITFSATKRRRVVGRGRTFKKVEVGLLEPFVFPAVSQRFLRTRLYSQEMLYEERRLMLRMSKGRRWRAHKSVADLSKSLERHWAVHNAGDASADADAERGPAAQLLVRKRSVPTARHGHILSAIAERRAQKAARLRAFLDAQRTAA